MLHRIHNPETGVHGHSIAFIREAIDALRNSGAKTVSLRTLVDAWRAGTDIDPDWVVFTLDDGFADHADMAQQAFVSMQCPVTIFLITGFLDGQCWPWDDQLSYVIRHANEHINRVLVAEKEFALELRTLDGQSKAVEAIRNHCKTVRGLNPYEAAKALAQQLDVQIPQKPPQHYQPIAWERARELERSGFVEFGPHSVSHRIFSTLDESESRIEIETSWNRVRAELRNPLPIFAWPTGRPGDFEDRDVLIARKAGLLASVSTKAGYAHRVAKDDPDSLFKLSRFSLPNELSTVLRYGSWLERGRQLLPV